MKAAAASLLAIMLAGCGALPEPAGAPVRRPNVLLVVVDDLRVGIGAYGDPIAITPHLDTLARQGVLFERAYVQQSVCGPSRASFLTGRRPQATGVTSNRLHFRIALPDAVTLPQWFRRHGWHAEAMGKVYHTGLDDPDSWSVPHWMPDSGRYSPATTIRERAFRAALAARGEGHSETPVMDPSGRFVARIEQAGRNRRFLVAEAPEVDDDVLGDGRIAARAIERLRVLADAPSPFFLAVGFSRPHAPFVAPRRYWDLYDPADLPLSPVPQRPEGAPSFAFVDSPEIRGYEDVPDQGPIPEALQRRMVHGYRAATSFVDAQIGRVLAELDALGLADETLVVVVGDHGYKLGDYGYWGKQSNVELDTRAPMILRLPGGARAGARVPQPVEFVDLYPTLAELAGLPVDGPLDGISLAPAIAGAVDPGAVAVSQYPRDGERIMGWSIRDARYRYTEWVERADGRVVARELYDHSVDPFEIRSLADDPAFADRRAALAARLSAVRRSGPAEASR